jgi:hypothetical protein
VGGKKALRKLIYTMFPVSFDRYIEVFGGGGWVLFGKPPDCRCMEVYNDYNSNLAKRKLAERSGEGYVDTAVKILIAVVLGALLLAGLYALFKDTVLPTLVNRIQQMFNYAG